MFVSSTFPDTRVFLTVAVDLVLVGIQEPVRFTLETKAKIYSVSERFWYLSRKGFSEQFNVCLKQVGKSRRPISCDKCFLLTILNFLNL